MYSPEISSIPSVRLIRASKFCESHRLAWGVNSMFIYQAVLPAVPAAVLAVRVSPVRTPGWRLGGGAPDRVFCITIRYAQEDGRVMAHRGRLRVDLAPDRSLRVAAWQMDGGVVTVTLAPPGRLRQPPVRRGLVDRFRLPIAFQAWGVTALEAAEVHLQASAQGQGEALLVRGAVTVLMQTPSAVLRVRCPFCRLLVAPEAGRLRWQVYGGAGSLRLTVHPGGRIDGDVELAFFYEGRPADLPQGLEPGGILLVRNLTAAVKNVRAEPVGEGFVLVQGTAELDASWVDGQHRSRWSSRIVPFSGMVRLEGGEPGDRLEAQAHVTQVQPLPRQGLGWAMLLISTLVTQLRTSHVRLGPGCYRLEEVVGEGAVTVERTVQWAEPGWLVGAQTLSEVMADLALPSLWHRLELNLLGRALPGQRWKVQGRMMTIPGEAAEGTAVQRRRGVWSGEMPPGMKQGVVVLPWLTQVGPEGAQVGAALLTDCAAYAGGIGPGQPGSGGPSQIGIGESGAGGKGHPGHPSGEVAAPRHTAIFDLPGTARWIMGLQARGGQGARVQVLLVCSEGTRLMDLQLPGAFASAPPEALLVCAVEREGQCRLMLEWTGG